jgi:hypothetical protein
MFNFFLEYQINIIYLYSIIYMLIFLKNKVKIDYYNIKLDNLIILYVY